MVKSIRRSVVCNGHRARYRQECFSGSRRRRRRCRDRRQGGSPRPVGEFLFVVAIAVTVHLIVRTDGYGSVCSARSGSIRGFCLPQTGVEQITCASSAACIALQDATGHKVVNVAQRSISGRVFKLRPFRTGEFSDKAVIITVMGWTAPRSASMCQDGRCHNPSEGSRPWSSLSGICRL